MRQYLGVGRPLSQLGQATGISRADMHLEVFEAPSDA